MAYFDLRTHGTGVGKLENVPLGCGRLWVGIEDGLHPQYGLTSADRAAVQSRVGDRIAVDAVHRRPKRNTARWICCVPLDDFRCGGSLL